MVKAKIITDHIFRNKDRGDIMHSSGYAKAQNGSSFGAAGAESFAERQSINQHRKFVQGYRNSQIMNRFYGVQRARTQAGYGRYGGRGQSGNASVGNGGTSTTGEARSTGGVGGAANPMDIAMRRSQFTASGATSRPIATHSGPILNNARASQIPNRRAGI